MSPATVLFFTRDLPLAATVRKVVEGVKNCRLLVFPHADETWLDLQLGNITLLVHHMGQDEEQDDVFRLMAKAKAADHSIATLVITDTHDPVVALRLLKGGVADCLCRPLDLRRLAFLVDSLTLRMRHTSASRKDASTSDDLEFFCCASPVMTSIMQQAARFADSGSSILITGQTGTGKTHLARLIHRLSPRKSEPFLSVNCAAIPEGLVESEMFGHRKGAFTGADFDRVGKFAAAGNGTLLLDEIDSLPLGVQAKLLRAVDERIFEQVGSHEPIDFGARIIVASNCSLDKEVAAGRFRADLFFRINVVELRLPPLSERMSEISLIANRFLVEIANRAGLPPHSLSTEVLHVLESYDWPGNIRELRNAIEHAVLLCDASTIGVDDLPRRLRSWIAKPPESTEETQVAANALSQTDDWVTESLLPKQSSVGDPADSGILPFAPDLSMLARTRIKAEIKRIKQVLNRTGNNRSQTAKELGISRVALYKKLRKYGLMGAESM